jgi:hypothetical protein
VIIQVLAGGDWRRQKPELLILRLSFDLLTLGKPSFAEYWTGKLCNNGMRQKEGEQGSVGKLLSFDFHCNTLL